MRALTRSSVARSARPHAALVSLTLTLLTSARGEADEAARSQPAAELPPSSARLVGTLALGDGVRFNNPFRLGRELGSGERSLSLTSPYVDVGLAYASGSATGLQHGAALRCSFALAGVSQAVLTPSYFAAIRGYHPVMAFGRLGPAIITGPDPNVGAEAALGGAYFVRAGIALSGELVGDLFYGAATPEVRYSVIPLISAQIGVLVDYEVLP